MTAQIGQLQAQLAELQTGSMDPGQVITPAERVGHELAGALLTYAVLRALAGLLLALAIVVIRARAENRIHHADDVVPSGLPLLGSVSMNEVLDTNEGIALLEDGESLQIGAGLQALRVAVLSGERRRPVRILYAAAAEALATLARPSACLRGSGLEPQDGAGGRHGRRRGHHQVPRAGGQPRLHRRARRGRARSRRWCG